MTNDKTNHESFDDMIVAWCPDCNDAMRCINWKTTQGNEPPLRRYECYGCNKVFELVQVMTE